MIGNYAYFPHILPTLATALLLLLISAYSWQRLRVPGALPFAIGSLFGALWVLMILMQQATLDSETKLFWFKVQTAWTLTAMTPVMCFSLEYTWPGRWLTRRNIAALAVFPLLAAAMVLTNEVHQLVWTSLRIDGEIIAERGVFGWLFLGYGFGLSVLEIIVFGFLFARSPQHRWPAALMIFGKLVSRAVFLFLNSSTPLFSISADVLAIGFPFLMYAIALFGFRILDPIWQANQTVIGQLRTGMLVVDAQGRIANLNAAAEKILQISAALAKGKPVCDWLPEFQKYSPENTMGQEIEIGLKVGAEIRYYGMAVSQLNDWRGSEIGRLVLLRDVTDQKRAQEQVIEQQRSLAILTERERMSRELHDSIGQVLAYAGLQVDTAVKLVCDGKEEAAAALLNRLGSVVREAHADVREYILNLRSAPGQDTRFFTSVRQYLEGYTNNYEIQTHLEIGIEVGEEPYSADGQMQVLRILQEALSNARKHGKARHVQVKFEVEDRQIRMIIQDDGGGFILGEVGGTGQKHFGLQFMQERAAELGGCVEYHSILGTGTRVVLTVPEKEM